MRPTRGTLAFALFFVCGIALYWPIFSILPLRGDNLYALAWVNSASLSEILHGDPAIYPEWRPLAYLTVWFEHQMGGLNAVPLHFLVNLATWVGCATLVHRIVFELTRSTLASYAAGLLVLADRRAEQALTWIIERQTLFACLFGLAALLVIITRRHRPLKPAEATVVGGLLLASLLSKEYGAAFAIAIAIYGVWQHRPRAAIAAVAAFSAYAALRLSLADGATNIYCEDMGFFRSVSYQCMDMSTASFIQAAYNAGASVIGTVLPGTFTDEGAITTARFTLAMGIVFAALALVAIRKGPREIGLVALLPITAGLMNFMIYRPRNQLAGIVAVAIMTGIGIALFEPMRSRPGLQRAARFAMLLLVAVVLSRRAYEAHQLVGVTVSELLDADPCESSLRKRDFGKRFAAMVKNGYGLPNPDCINLD